LKEKKKDDKKGRMDQNDIDSTTTTFITINRKNQHNDNNDNNNNNNNDDDDDDNNNATFNITLSRNTNDQSVRIKSIKEVDDSNNKPTTSQKRIFDEINEQTSDSNEQPKNENIETQTDFEDVNNDDGDDPQNSNESKRYKQSEEEEETQPESINQIEPSSPLTIQRSDSINSLHFSDSGSDVDLSDVKPYKPSQAELNSQKEKEKELERQKIYSKPSNYWHNIHLTKTFKKNTLKFNDIMNQQFGFSSRPNPNYLTSNNEFVHKAMGSLSSVRKMELSRSLNGHKGCVNAIDFNKDGSKMVNLVVLVLIPIDLTR
jgi:hypothetical protein